MCYSTFLKLSFLITFMWLIFDVNGVITKNIELDIIIKFCKKNRKNLVFIMLRYFREASPYYKGCLSGKEFWGFVLGKGGYEFVLDSYSKSTFLDKKIVDKFIELRKKGFKIGILSNSCDIMSEGYKKKGFYNFADRVYLSDKIHMIKPFPSTFRFVVHDIGVKPKHVLLIDDSWYNILASRLFGWRAIWFKDIHSLELIESKFTPITTKIKISFKNRKKSISKKINITKRKIKKIKFKKNEKMN
jgi:HAD superfamily hydrolase (TIGR01509 family)